MTREQAEADVREILAAGADDIPLDGSQWAMPWELTEAERRKAGVTAVAAPALRGDWKAKLDELDH